MICKHVLLITSLNEPVLIFFFLQPVKRFQVLLSITNNPIKHQSFIYTQLKDQTVLFQLIQSSISHVFAFSLNVKQFYLTHRQNCIRCYHSGTRVNQGGIAMKGYSAFVLR